MKIKPLFSLLSLTLWTLMLGLLLIYLPQTSNAQAPEKSNITKNLNFGGTNGAENSPPWASYNFLSPTSLDDVRPAATQACVEGTQTSGALYQICLPTGVYTQLVVYAHGYVAPNQPLAIPSEIGQIAALLNGQSYAVASTSYSTNGLAILPGVADLVDLVNIFTTTQAVTPTYVYAFGFSEGGIVTTLSVERHPDIFDGGLAACGPIGDFSAQLDYIADFRLVFDYYFPNLMPGDPITIPQSLMDNWDNHYNTVIQPAITNPSNAYSVTQLLQVTGAPTDTVGNNAASIAATIEGVLWYNVFATNDATAKLGGTPFDNQNKVYSGSDDDTALNNNIGRYTADSAALTEVAKYESNGALTNPLITLHTSLDPIVPYWHESLYQAKVISRGTQIKHDNIIVERYGHCNFDTFSDLLPAFNLMVDRVQNPVGYKVFVPILAKP